jgi:hypothetical protein
MRTLKCQKLVLTTGFLNKLKSDIDLQITDAALPGLQCRYSAASGRKVFYLGYRVRGSYQQKHMRLGTLTEFSLNEIRARAIQTKQDIAKGLDPQSEQRIRIKQNEMAAARRKQVRELTPIFMEKHCSVISFNYILLSQIFIYGAHFLIAIWRIFQLLIT